MNGKIACLIIGMFSLAALTQIGRADCTGCSSSSPIGTLTFTRPDFRIQESREIFRMAADACLRGPLYFLDREGKKMFELQAGVDYPTGCSKEQKQ